MESTRENVRLLRLSGKSYGEISSELELNKNTVVWHVRELGLTSDEGKSELELKKRCEKCFKEYTTYYHTKKYCSNTCQNRATYERTKARTEKNKKKAFFSNCKVCKIKFESNHKNKLYCGKECSESYRKKNRIKVGKCATCGGEFSNGRHKYCSDECAEVKVKKECGSCGSFFFTKDKKQKFCSMKCSKDMLSELFSFEVNADVLTEDFERKFNDKFEGFEYHSDYKGWNSLFKYKCKKCDALLERHAECIRRDRTMACSYCQEVEREERIEEAKKERLFKSQERKRISEEKKRIAEEERNRLHEFTCYNCNETFMSRRKKKYCSNRCMNKYNYATKTIRRRKRVIENGQVEWDITVDKLIKLYDNTCYLCDGQCNSNDHIYNDGGAFIAGGNYPSIEHVIPISKGGTHTWDNVRLAHCYCNTIKSDKQLDSNREQLELPV